MMCRKMIESLKQRWRTYKRDRWLRKCARDWDRDKEFIRQSIQEARRKRDYK